VNALLLRFLRDESGRGLSEAVLVTGTSLLIIPSVEHVGAKLVAVFEKLARALH
jgi:Flp pilus assembly pilin Flp